MKGKPGKDGTVRDYQSDHSHSGSHSGSSFSDAGSSFSDDSDDHLSSIHEDQIDQREKELAKVQNLSRWENLGVRFWRTVVLILLVLAGVLLSMGTYVFLQDAEKQDYETRYFLFTETIGNAAVFHVANMNQAVRSLSETVTLSAVATNSSFPFVTTPIFEVHGHHAREQSGILSISYTPIIQFTQVDAWNNYSKEHQGWIEQSRQFVLANQGMPVEAAVTDGNDGDLLLVSGSGDDAKHFVNGSIAPFIYEIDQDGKVIPAPGQGPFAPVWLLSPPPFDIAYINSNSLSEHSITRVLYPVVSLSREAVFSDVLDLTDILKQAVDPDLTSIHSDFSARDQAGKEDVASHPHSFLMQPVFGVLNDPKSDLVGILQSIVPWDRYLSGLLPSGVSGIVCVLKNTCGQSFTYVLEGNMATYMGEGDLHDPWYNDTSAEIPLYNYLYPNRTGNVQGHCEYTLICYGSKEYTEQSQSNTPVIFTTIVAAVFFLVIVTFVIYDSYVQRRNTKVVDAAARSNAILSSLFPTNIRERLFAEKDEAQPGRGAAAVGTKNRLRSFLDNDGSAEVQGANEGLGYEGKPIADLFPETTIMFADIAGFTAWSSVREPCQVFTLLETLYRAFDEVAKRRRVFKVETVGDCYVAVTGLPDARKDHALAMARFARDCMFRARTLTKKLEVSLGPDTGDLCMRMGLHSGPVTAGVLRGERSRFQLFGDTMNTASRMESTGERGRIQISQETADLLIGAGKTEWLTLREQKVVAKGKGEMQTYWLALGETRQQSSRSLGSGSSHGITSEHTSDDDDGNAEGKAAIKMEVTEETPDPMSSGISESKKARLIEWNLDVLLRLLKQIVARRTACGLPAFGDSDVESTVTFGDEKHTTIEEVAEIITLPNFNEQAAVKHEGPDSIQLPREVVDQLYDFVSNIAAIYNENPFHNFEHASHVTMSVVKLLSRIVAPSDIEVENEDLADQTLHDHTYGITSDPLTQFACVFSALIHDADHSGVPNAQLVQENAHIAKYYSGKSVAEQNSVDLAWHLLLDESYVDLRRAIYSTEAEFNRFRQLVVNSVMATDIVDKELKTLRNARWAKAFSDDGSMGGKQDTSSRDAVNRKATIVIEHLIQASDVAHTMQHWHVYRKWNERFFIECHKAYKDGRAERDPAETWYQGELGFYDFYIIPLAKKLKDCGVFGVSSDEYLNYAIRNRKEWESRGREVVDEMIEMVNKKARNNTETKLTLIDNPTRKTGTAPTA